MARDLSNTPGYRDTMARLESVKRVNEDGVPYWMARDIHPILGYHVWDKFEPVIERAVTSLRENMIDPSHHIAPASNMMEVGKGARRQGVDYFLSKAACSLIAMNGDPSKPEIAAAQAYFVVQTHRMEQEDQRSEDEKRVELREKVSQSVKVVSGVAQDAGVRNQMQGIFHDARYQGLYGMSLKDVKLAKNLGEKDQLLDRAGSLELSAQEFQMNLAANVIANDATKGEQRAIKTNFDVARRVRNTMYYSGAIMPEKLPLADPIKEVRKRLEAQKKLPPTDTPSST